MIKTLKVTVFVFISVEICYSQVAPNISIHFPDIADADFENETRAFISNSNPIFVLNCNASYPVEWIIHYNKDDDGISQENKIIEVFRHVEDFENPESYSYATTLRLEYKGKLLVLANFTCKHPSNEVTRQKHVIMGERDDKQVLILKISDQLELEGMQIGKNKNCKIFSNVTHFVTNRSRKSCWSCGKTSGTKDDYELDFVTCQTASECNSMHQKLQRGKTCLIENHITVVPEMCKHLKPLDFKPKLVICKDFGPVLAQLYFHGVFTGNFSDKTAPRPKMYFDWTNINPQDMLYFHPLQNYSYQSQPLQFICEFSRYYFALGSWLAIKSSNETLFYKGNDTRSWSTTQEKENCKEKFEDNFRGTFKSIFNIPLNDTGTYEIFCIGPIWNSTGWINASQTVTVITGHKPKVLSIEVDHATDFYFGERNRSLRCNFEGLPSPSVEWTGPIPLKGTKEENHSILLIPEVGYQSSGKYSCSVSSYLGQDAKTFELNSKFRKLSGIIIAGIVVFSLVIVIFVAGGFWRMKVIISQQQTQLRVLTDAEIQEFLNGKPELLEDALNTGLGNYVSMEALPFDRSYEIDKEKLVIEYSKILGSGEFGLVFSGILKNDSTSPGSENENYANFFTEGLTVAVKTCKQDVDVDTFKTLLTELKIMAYLGKHDNLVSLIGAVTGSIRNRELFIAVEYCEGGSLENYLKNNKSLFVNKVRYGIFSEEHTIPGAYTNLQGTFSSKELFKWSSEIAKGLEYMHEKKVIHADLAIRNVLLGKGGIAKVGDFGLSRQLTETSSYTKQTQCALPWRNMAIESLKELLFTPKSDIWSLGVTYWEIFSLGEIPYPGINFSPSFLPELEKGMRLIKPPGATNDMYDFMLMCWNLTPDHRPSLADAVMLCENFLIKSH